MSGIKIRQGGALTTVQDQGRYGYQDAGFGTSGAMDAASFRMANLLLGNERNEAMLEATLLGPEVEFETENCFVLTGGDMDARLDEEPVERYRVMTAKAGSVLKLGFAKEGLRAYLAFAGGLKLQKAMGSCSTSLKYGLGGLDGRKLMPGDVLSFKKAKASLKHMERRHVKAPSFAGKELELQVIPGPQEDYFTEDGLRTFFEDIYTVKPESDRMGYRLEGTPVAYKETVDIISDATVPGAIQIPSDGKPIVLLADRQTTGGYAKLGAVRTVDLSRLAQAAPGTGIHFKRCTVFEAQKAMEEEEKKYRSLERSINRWL